MMVPQEALNVQWLTVLAKEMRHRLSYTRNIRVSHRRESLSLGNVSSTSIRDDTDSWHKMASRSHIHKDMNKPGQKVHCRLRRNILSWWLWVWLNIWWRHRNRSSHMMSQENSQYRQESVTRSQIRKMLEEKVTSQFLSYYTVYS